MRKWIYGARPRLHKIATSQLLITMCVPLAKLTTRKRVPNLLCQVSLQDNRFEQLHLPFRWKMKQNANACEVLWGTTSLLSCFVFLVWTARCVQISLSTSILVMHYFDVCEARDESTYVWAKHMLGLFGIGISQNLRLLTLPCISYSLNCMLSLGWIFYGMSTQVKVLGW